MNAHGQLWAILYGAGDCETETLARSITRISALIPKKRILVVATPESRDAHSVVLATLPAKNSVYAPLERGAPAALLLALFRLPLNVRVLFIPAAHEVENDAVFLRALQAASETQAHPVVLANTGIFAGSGSELMRLYEHALPGLLRTFLATFRGRTAWSEETLGDLFRFLPKKHLEDLLEPSAGRLCTVPLEICGYQNLLSSSSLRPRALRI